MNVRIKRISALVFLACAAPVVFSACAKNESSLFVHGCLIPTSDTCMVTADPTQPYYSEGILDARYALEYNCEMLLGNQLVQRGNATTLKTETSRIEITGADVTILDANGDTITVRQPDGSVAAADFEVTTTGFVDVGLGALPGYGVATVKLLDAATAEALGKQALTNNLQQDVVASVIVRGRDLGGDEVETAPFNFPLRVCYGCLCTVPPGVDCTDRTDKPTANCHVGTDLPVDCRFDPTAVETGSCPE